MSPEQSLFVEDSPDDDPIVDPDARYLRVAIERGMDANWSAGDAQGLTYAAPPEPTDAPLRPGHAVMVPLGRSNAQVRGLVIETGGPELLGSLSPAKVKQAALLPDAPLPPALVELGLWLAKYYVCPLGMAFASMVPAAVKKATGARTQTRLALSPDSAQRVSDLKLPPTAKAAWHAINELEPSPFPCSAIELRTALGIRSVAPINRLIKLGLLTTSTAETVRTTEIRSFTDASSPAPAPTPTPDQARVIEGISLSLGTFHTHLLLGVTGSGKTEVYIRLVERTLASGRGAIVLVPEISLTPQAATRYASRLGKDQVVVLHSGLTASQRHAGWRRLAEGSARVVVGARSAVFAPMRDIGLIVVDEEHDPSFKQDQLPRYHGKDVAIKRAQIENATVLLGSATPSLESFANTRTDRSTLWRLDRRIGNATMPKVRIVDMRIDPRDSDTSNPAIKDRPELIGPTLARALLDTLNHHDAPSHAGQAILLLNRRGFGRRIGCVDRRCGWTLACDHCDANLVWHKAADLPHAGTMRCHHCLAEQRLPTRCPACSKAVRALQIGTQRLEQDLAEWLDLEAGNSLLRLDADVAAISGGMLDVLDRFASGQGRVLLGTQMVAKGLDFPNVRLVGVLDADQALAIPDFRASERTFQLVAQVAGRAGRGEHPGRVIVQTHEPTSPAIQAAANHDFDAFAASELRHRVHASLPPSTRMVRLVARDQDHAKAQAAAQALADAIHEHDPKNEVEVLGPMPCVIARIADHFRFAVELFSPRATTLQRVLAGARSQGLLKSDRHTAIDVDPVTLL